MSYKNPVPRFGGKKFRLNIVFDYEDWVEIEDAIKGIEQYFIDNGIPQCCVSDITPSDAYCE